MDVDRKERDMQEIVERWRRARERALEERVRVLEIGGKFFATSSSRPMGTYELRRTEEGWSCSCVANEQYHNPCKHLAALAEVTDMDLLSDVRLDLEALQADTRAA